MIRKQLMLILLILFLPVIVGFIVSTTKNSDNNRLSFGKKNIGHIEISDVIYESESYVKQLDAFRLDDQIAGVILRINSPGGGVAASQEIYESVLRYHEKNKPIIVSMSSVAASGGYYIASAADLIFANAGTITGSIGVIFQFPHYYKLLEKIGVDFTTITAGKMKDVGNPNRKMTKVEHKYLKSMIQNTHNQFIRDVCIGRNMSEEVLRPLADGRIFTGEQAHDVGLVDTIGSYSSAAEYTKKISNVTVESKIIKQSNKKDFLRNLLSETIQDIFPIIKKGRLHGGSFFLLQNFQP